MIGLRQLMRMFDGNPKSQTAIRALWREYYALYNEKYDSNPNPDAGEAWKRNIIDGEVRFGQAIGQDHLVLGNQSLAIGIGGIASAFREIILGSYGTEAEIAHPQEWDELDRLISIGNGIDENNRKDALILFKSGLFKLFNALQLGAYSHGDEESLPDDGILQYQEKKVEVSIDGQWHELALKSEVSEDLIIFQINHGFSIGQAIKPTALGWITTKADKASNAGTVGIICEVVDADHFRYLESGSLSGNYEPGKVYFLSPYNYGELIVKDDPEVWSVGQIREDIGTANADGTALVISIGTGIEIAEGLFNERFVQQMLYDIPTRTLTLRRSAGLPDLCVQIPLGIVLSAVAYSGKYADLTEKPSLFSGDFNDLDNLPNLEKAFTGLTDVIPENYIGKALCVPMVTAEQDKLDLTETEELETDTARTILLEDMPQSLTGKGGWILRVKLDESGYELYQP